MIDINKSTVEEIFSDFVITAEFDNDIEQLTHDVYQMREQYPRQDYSNVGGWQSPVFGPQCPVSVLNQLPESLSQLQWDVWGFINSIVQSKFQKSLRKDHMGWWVNINDKHCYNSIHLHGRTDIIAVAYIKSKPNSGDLVVTRNDGSNYSELYHEYKHRYPPDVGKLIILPGHLWHHVEDNHNHDDRISVSYNFYTQINRIP